MTPLAIAVSRALIHFVWQGAIVALGLWTVLFLLRRRSAHARYVAGCAALGVLAALPLLTAWISYAPVEPAAQVAEPSTPMMGPAVKQAPSLAVAWLTGLQYWVVPVWSIGVLVFSARMLVGYRHTRLMRRRGKTVGDSVKSLVERLQRVMRVRRQVGVLISPLVDSPSVVGWLRPVILLPAATLAGLTPLQFEAILAHEIAHIKRYDYLVNMFQMLVETLLFYHPAVWWTSRRIRTERELSCDDLAVVVSGDPLRYARALTMLEKLRLNTPELVMASTGGPLLYRIQRLAGLPAKEHGLSRIPIAVTVGLGALSLALNVGWSQGRQDAPGVTVDLGTATVIHRSPVRYPEPAAKQNISGTVQLEVKLDSTGTVADARVLTGPEELRRAALQSVLDWHFTRDSAGGIRLITISFSDQGTQVQVQSKQTIDLLQQQAMEIVKVKLVAESKRAEFASEKAKIHELQAKLVFLKSEDPQTSDTIKLERSIAELSMALAAAKAELEHEKALLAGLAQDQQRLQENLVADELKKLGDLELARTELEKVRAAEQGLARGRSVIGRLLQEISTPGLGDGVRNDLMSRLPIRVGDTLSEQLWRETDAAIHAYDEHLRVQFVTTSDGQVQLRISAR